MPTGPSKSRPVSLITGAAGFLGSHLADRLLAEGHDIIGVDNLITGNLENIGHLSKEPRFRFIKQDICDGLEVAGPVNFLYQLASPASTIDYL